MYIFTPIFIKWAYKNGPSKTLVFTIIASVLSIAAQLGVFHWKTDCSVSKEADYEAWVSNCQGQWHHWIYMQTYSKIGSYLIGAYTAMLIRNDKEHSYQERIHPVVEWFCFVGMISLLYLPEYISFPFENKGILVELASFSYRYVFSAFLAVIILVSMSPKQDTPISWARPSKYFRGFLSLSIWLPIATLSYSIYLWHFIIMWQLSEATIYDSSKKQIDQLSAATQCADISKIGVGIAFDLFWKCLLITIVVSSFSYVFVEKSAIDARRAFKTKWDKIKEKEQE